MVSLALAPEEKGLGIPEERESNYDVLTAQQVWSETPKDPIEKHR